MILEFSFRYFSSSLVYERIIVRTAKLFDVECKIVKKNDDELLAYIKSDDIDRLENFANKLSTELPHSIFLYKTEVKAVEEMPIDYLNFKQTKKLMMPFCPKCLAEVMDETNQNYYNPFHECEVCGYSLEGETKSYKESFVNIAKLIDDGLVVELDLLYGRYIVGKLGKACSNIDFDVVSYDLSTIEKYTNATKNEIVALGSIEKPLIKLKTNLTFKMNYEDVQDDLIRFKLADDFVLHLLLTELHKFGVDLLFITKDELNVDITFDIIQHQQVAEPIECVVSESHLAIVKGDKGLPVYKQKHTDIIPHIGAFFSVIKEYSLLDYTVAGVNISKEYHNDILVYSKKFGTIEYLSFKFEFTSIQDVFDAISNTNETGARLVKNFKMKFAQHFEEISLIEFDDKMFNIHKLWGITAIILGYSKEKSLVQSAQIIEESASSFLGTKGPRIDYKLKKNDSKVYLDPLMTIRTAMSFRLADVDQLMLSYGIVESFVEFISNQLDEIKNEMKIDGVVVTGSLLGNRALFRKLCKEASLNHTLYFNKEMPVDGVNIYYGGNELF